MIKPIGALILLVSLTDSLPAAQSTAPPATPHGIARTQLLDNPTVLVARLRFAPGAKEEPHTHPFSAVVVHLGPAEVDMLLGAERQTSNRDRGFTEVIAKEVTHAAANVGSQPFEIVTIAIKPDRTSHQVGRAFTRLRSSSFGEVSPGRSAKADRPASTG